MRKVPVLVIAIAFITAACGGEVASTTTVLASTTTTGPSTTTTATPTTTSVPTTTTIPAGTTTLAGGPVDLGPAEGDVLMVIGVRYDDVLNLRQSPGVAHTIAAEIPPTYDDLVARGNTWQLPTSFWVEVDYEGTIGWIHLGYVGYQGATTDDTSRLISELGTTPTEPTMTDLGELIASHYATEDEQGSDVVQVAPVTTGDLAEVTYDVIGLADDAIRGVRIHVFAEQTDGGFGLKSVEVTALCGRGVDEDGTCP